MNDSNLKKFGDGSRSKETEKALQEKGGKNSGAVRRRKRSVKQLAIALLNMSADPDKAVEMDAMKIPKDEQTNQMAVLVAVLKKALNGDVRAAEFLRDVSGENPADKFRALEIKQRYAYEEDRLDLERERLEYWKGESIEYEDLSDAEDQIYGDDPEDPENTDQAEGREYDD